MNNPQSGKMPSIVIGVIIGLVVGGLLGVAFDRQKLFQKPSATNATGRLATLSKINLNPAVDWTLAFRGTVVSVADKARDKTVNNQLTIQKENGAPVEFIVDNQAVFVTIGNKLAASKRKFEPSDVKPGDKIVVIARVLPAGLIIATSIQVVQ